MNVPTGVATGITATITKYINTKHITFLKQRALLPILRESSQRIAQIELDIYHHTLAIYRLSPRIPRKFQLPEKGYHDTTSND